MKKSSRKSGSSHVQAEGPGGHDGAAERPETFKFEDEDNAKPMI